MTKKQREKLRKRRETAREWARQCEVDDQDRAPLDDEPARPSEFGICSLDQAIADGEDLVKGVYLHCRDSTRKQHLPSLVTGAYRRIEQAGVRVRQSWSEHAPSPSLDPADRPGLHKALAAAGRNGVKLVVPCLSRLLRSEYYHAYRNPEARPSVGEFKKLIAVLAQYGLTGEDILTLNNPERL